jgi:hypothetical protein
VLFLHPPVLVLVSEKKFCHCLIKGEKTNKKTTKNKNKQIPSSNGIQFLLVLQHPVLVLSLSHQRTRKTTKTNRKKKSVDSLANVYLRLWLTCYLLSAICYYRLYLCRSQEWALHSPSPPGFVCLGSPGHMPLLFSPVFSSTRMLQLRVEFTWGCSSPPPVESATL